MGASSPPKTQVDKKTIPTLPKFSGLDEDFYLWDISVKNTLGQAGLGRYVTDSSLSATNPEVAEAVFYAIKTAVQDGHAHTIAGKLHDADHFDPFLLYSDLTGHYDTAINKANVVLFEIRRLLSFRLDPDVLPTKFISDFQESIMRLRKHKAAIADDKDTIRALLLFALQDDAFDSVRDHIIEHPEKSVDEILRDIRERDSSLLLKEGSHRDIKGDGTFVRGRRVSFLDRSSRSTKPSNPPSRWFIPRFPDSWKQAIGAKLFAVLLQWRTAAVRQGLTQDQLNKDFELLTDSVPGAGKRKSRRAPTSSTPEEATVDEEAPSTPPDDTANERPRKRIRLAKSRRVVTERSS